MNEAGFCWWPAIEPIRMEDSNEEKKKKKVYVNGLQKSLGQCPTATTAKVRYKPKI